MLNALFDKVILDFKYDEMAQINFYKDEFENSFAKFIARKSDLYGLLDQSDKVVLPFKYESIRQVRSTKNFMVRKDQKRGMVNNMVEILIPLIYDTIYNSYFEHERLTTEIGENEGRIDRDAGVTIPAIYFNIKPVEKYGYLVSILDDGYKAGYLSYNGESLIPIKYKSVLLVDEDVNEASLQCLCVENPEGKIALYNWSGQPLTDFVFDNVEYFQRSTLLVDIGDLQFELNQFGECINDCPSKEKLKRYNLKLNVE